MDSPTKLDPFTKLHARLMADEFTTQALWAAFIKSQGGNVSWVSEIASEGRALLAEAGEGEDENIVTEVLQQYDRMWLRIGTHLEGQLSNPAG